MDRIVRYRVWDNEEKKFYFGSEVTLNPQGEVYYAGMKYKGRFVVQLFSGLQDKNGKDIYEGDVLESRFEPFPFLVSWGGGEDEDGYFTGLNVGVDDVADGELEIIGNNFETPELIK